MPPRAQAGGHRLELTSSSRKGYLPARNDLAAPETRAAETNTNTPQQREEESGGKSEHKFCNVHTAYVWSLVIPHTLAAAHHLGGGALLGSRCAYAGGCCCCCCCCGWPSGAPLPVAATATAPPPASRPPALRSEEAPPPAFITAVALEKSTMPPAVTALQLGREAGGERRRVGGRRLPLPRHRRWEPFWPPYAAASM